MTGTVGTAALFRQWAAAAHRTAVACHTKGDLFGVKLAMARAEVYALAAELSRSMAPGKLSGLLAGSELAHHVPVRSDAVPLAGADQAFLQHVRAMAWGLCARTVDPAHVPVEQPW